MGMPNHPNRPRDVNQLAKLIVDIATGEALPELEPTTRQVAGRKGGIKGGAARTKK